MKKEPLPKGAWWKIARFWIVLFFVMAFVLFLLGALIPICSIKKAQQSACVQTAHAIAQALNAYSEDHNGKYPEGKTSTEVFQQLLDQDYITDPSIFYVSYLRIPGKVAPISKMLKSENVSWDVTAGIDTSSPAHVPVVFLSGYKVVYLPGAAATLAHPPPTRTWSQWSDGVPAWEPFMAFACKDVTFKTVIANDDGSIPNFIPADFDPKGKTYRQLTP